MENKEKQITLKNLSVNCNRFKEEKLVLELPKITDYSSLSYTLNKLIRGINIIADINTEGCKDERLEIISELSDIAIAMDCYDEFYYLDKVLLNEKTPK